MPMDKTERDFSLLRLLPMLQRVVLRCWDREKYPYTKSQLTLFLALLQKDSITMKEAASYISSSKEQATRAVAPMVDCGLLERYTDPVNRSFIHIRLTDRGRAHVYEMLAELCDQTGILLDSALEKEEQQELFQSLAACIRILSKIK